MDVWFDSGAMPFAQDHYPFEKKEWIEGAGYPADFISEAIDQTRGWFYTLLAVSALIDKPAPFKNAICLGHLLDAKGQKMSKSKGNVIDAWEQMEKFGADSVRMWMFSVTQPGDSKNYDEKVVAEMQGKIFTLLYNVLSFYELYRDKDLEVDLERSFLANPPTGGEKGKSLPNSQNILDQWILARLAQMTELTTTSLDNYKIFEPARGFRDFTGDLSTWYLRRSRDRIKDGDKEAKETLYVVLKTISKLLAPFAPFAAEDIWQKLKVESDPQSVHLTNWPEARGIHSDILENMRITRDVCTEGNALRKKLNIPVRQPLQTLKVKAYNLGAEYTELIKEELNVKNVVEDKNIASEYELDTNLTPELKLEGDYRELVRGVQELRKTGGLTPSDRVTITIAPEAESLLITFMEDFKKTVLADSVAFADNDGTEVKAGEKTYKVRIEK